MTDVSLDLLRRTPLLGVDPWVSAAEIAISSSTEEKSIVAKKAFSLIDSGCFGDAQLTELLSALASLELDHGRDKSAKVLFKRSCRCLRTQSQRHCLLCPNENSLAQAQSTKLNFGRDIDELNRVVPASFESISRQRYDKDNFQESLSAAGLWHMDQPFSAAPAIFAGYLASVGLDDFEKSVSISDGAIKSAPCHFLLHNNKAFGLASMGKISEARAELLKAPSGIDEIDNAVLYATTGLICYREGNHEAGAALYEKSISILRRNRDHKPFLSAAFWLREELLISGPNVERAFTQAKDFFRFVSDPAARRLWKRVKQDYDKFRNSKGSAQKS